MAGDWIKMRAGLLSHPKLIAMTWGLLQSNSFLEWITPGGVGAWRLGPIPPGTDHDEWSGVVSFSALRCVTLGALLRVWSYAREYGHLAKDDIVLRHIKIEGLDAIAEIPGVGLAMKSVHWANELPNGDGVSLPGFLEYNAPKTNAERQRTFRKRNAGRVTPRNDRVTKSNAKSVTNALLEERRGDDDNNDDRCVRARKSIATPPEPTEAAEEPPPPSDREQLYDWLLTAKGFGHVKAIEILDRGLTLEDMAEWESYETEHGTRLARHWLKRVIRPSEIPAEKQGRVSGGDYGTQAAAETLKWIKDQEEKTDDRVD